MKVCSVLLFVPVVACGLGYKLAGVVRAWGALKASLVEDSGSSC